MMQEDLVARYRYPRRSVPARRRRKEANVEASPLIEKMAAQIVVCIAILLLSAIARWWEVPPMNFLENKIRWVLTADTDVKVMYNWMDSFSKKLVPGLAKKDVQDQVDNGKTTGGGGTDGTEDTNTLLPSLIAPVNGTITSPFGNRVHPVNQTESMHKGVDIDAPDGAEIKAAHDGLVMEAGADQGYGNYLKVRHSSGVITVYAHCSALLAKTGDEVKQGDVIAKVGSTGVSTGFHLHFELWVDDEPVDPTQYLKLPVVPDAEIQSAET